MQTVIMSVGMNSWRGRIIVVDLLKYAERSFSPKELSDMKDLERVSQICVLGYSCRIDILRFSCNCERGFQKMLPLSEGHTSIRSRHANPLLFHGKTSAKFSTSHQLVTPPKIRFHAIALTGTFWSYFTKGLIVNEQAPLAVIFSKWPSKWLDVIAPPGTHKWKDFKAALSES